MPDEELTKQIDAFLEGDQGFADDVVERYYQQLVVLARNKLSSLPAQVGDDEGAVISALRSFFSGIKKAQFTPFEDRDGLWRMLAVITIRKAIAQIRRYRKKSGEGGKIDVDRELNLLFSDEPSPDQVVSMIDECECRIGSLQDETLQKIATMTLAGFDTQEIAVELDVHRRTIQRKIELIRDKWRNDHL